MAQEPEITIKEVFERLAALETKFDVQIERNNRIAPIFWGFIVFLVIVNTLNVAVHYWMFVRP